MIEIDKKFNGGYGRIIITQMNHFYEEDDQVIGISEYEWQDLVRAGIDLRWKLPVDLKEHA